MHVHFLFVGAVVLIGARTAEPETFYRASFPDATILDLAMTSSPSSSTGYDFDVWITVTRRLPGGGIGYRDASRHAAKVRCAAPVNVSIGGNDYPVLNVAPSELATDWKSDLWLTLCRQPLS